MDIMGFTDPLMLQIDVPGEPRYLQESIADIIAFLPRLIGAVVILLVGWIIGRLVAGAVRRIVDRTEVDRLVMNTPLGGALGGSERAISRSLGRAAGTSCTRWRYSRRRTRSTSNSCRVDRSRRVVPSGVHRRRAHHRYRLRSRGLRCRYRRTRRRSRRLATPTCSPMGCASSSTSL